MGYLGSYADFTLPSIHIPVLFSRSPLHLEFVNPVYLHYKLSGGYHSLNIIFLASFQEIIYMNVYDGQLYGNVEDWD